MGLADANYPNYAGNPQTNLSDYPDVPAETGIAHASDYNKLDNEILKHQQLLSGFGWENLSSQISTGNKIFKTAHNFRGDSLMIFANRTLLIYNVDYTVTGPDEFTLTETMDYVTRMMVVYFRS